MIYNLQALRAVAAAMVVLHHLREMLGQVFPALARIEVGAAGVDVFFVLSGVVITLAEHGRNDGPVAFLRRRAQRIVPMYWLTLWVIGLMVLAGLSPIGVQPVDGTVGNMLRSMFFVPFERAHGAIMPLLGVGWTLNYEVFFYAVVAALLVFPGRMRTAALVAVMVALSGVGVLLRPDSVAGKVYCNPILLEFAAGVLLAEAWLRWPAVPGRSQRGAAVAGIALIVLGSVWFIGAARPEGFTFLMRDRVLWFGIPAVTWVAAAMLLERSGLSLRNRTVQMLGAASYVLYLSHAFVIQIAEKIVHRLELPIGEPSGAILLAGAIFALAHCVGVGLHLWVERPVSAALKPGRGRSAARPT